MSVLALLAATWGDQTAVLISMDELIPLSSKVLESTNCAFEAKRWHLWSHLTQVSESMTRRQWLAVLTGARTIRTSTVTDGVSVMFGLIDDVGRRLSRIYFTLA
ncbi:hypothetical protein BV20DRAFT_874349 [Pilatotrama ljubarskyi]|nr:hypothetical protein BV20DRAFT_874349 [Pilatotrama ljubarskyi]